MRRWRRAGRAVRRVYARVRAGDAPRLSVVFELRLSVVPDGLHALLPPLTRSQQSDDESQWARQRKL